MGVVFLICSILLSIAMFFIGNITIFDSVVFAVTAVLIAHLGLHIHLAISLVIGIVVLVLMFRLIHTRYGFWIIGILMSLLGALFWGYMAFDGSKYDPVWGWVVGIMSFIGLIALHKHSLNKNKPM